MHPSTDRPDLLVVSSELPWPLNTGGHLRTYHLLRALAARCRVRLVTVVERADDPGLAVLEGHGIAVIPAVCGPRHKVREGLRAVRAALQGEPYVMFHRHNRGPLRNALRRALALRSPEVVYLDHLDPLAFRTMLPRVPLGRQRGLRRRHPRSDGRDGPGVPHLRRRHPMLRWDHLRRRHLLPRMRRRELARLRCRSQRARWLRHVPGRNALPCRRALPRWRVLCPQLHPALDARLW